MIENLETPEVETPEVETPEVQVETPEVQTEQKEQVEPTATLPKSEEDLNKLLQSTSSKAKGEILKELGFKNVKEIKDAIAKGLEIDILNETVVNLTTERDAIVVERDTLKNEIQSRDDKELIEKNQIPQESAELFLSLINSNAKEGETRQETATRIKEQLVLMAGVDLKIGSDKTKPQVLTEKELMAKLRNL